MSEPAPILFLTGPAAAGKNTIAASLAERVNHLAVIDLDAVRWMLLKPHVAPWGGEEGRRQQELGVKNASALARNFAEEHIPVLLIDVITSQTADLYRQNLTGLRFRIVLVLPSWTAAEKRRLSRPATITTDEARLLYEWQRELKGFDHQIDNTEVSADEVAEQLAQLLRAAV